MTTRLNAFAVAPAGIQKMIELEDVLRNSGLEYALYELVKMRASQINQCAFCLHMHSKDARAAGETEERLHLLPAWRESSFYTPRERAALAWTEALTNVAQSCAPDADYEGLKVHFSEVEIVNLTLLIGLINSWNRMAIGLRSQHPKTWSAAAKAA